MNPKDALDCKSMNEDDFVKILNHALDYGYGPHPKSISSGSVDMFSWFRGDATLSAKECFEVPPRVVKLASERMVFPLSLKHANNYVSKRVVLIGDAAHTVHPLAGQGVNLGFGDASTLSRIIAEGIAVGADIGEVCNVIFLLCIYAMQVLVFIIFIIWYHIHCHVRKLPLVAMRKVRFKSHRCLLRSFLKCCVRK